MITFFSENGMVNGILFFFFFFCKCSSKVGHSRHHLHSLPLNQTVQESKTWRSQERDRPAGKAFNGRPNASMIGEVTSGVLNSRRLSCPI